MAASVKQRLLDLSRKRGEDFNLLLARYGIERLLYRLSLSDHASDFILKGAVLFRLWSEVPHRSTRDLDLLGRGSPDPERLAGVFRDVCGDVPGDDGVEFEPDTVQAEWIREEAPYDGVRVRIEGHMGSARIRLQIDVGYGDVIVPPAEAVELPVLLDLPSPRLKAYRPETVIAEKLQSIVDLGMANSRMKDFFDLRYIASHLSISGPDLCDALRETFAHRRTPLPTGRPRAFTEEFARDETKRIQWLAFLRRTGLVTGALNLEQVIEDICNFLLPPLEALASGNDFEMSWTRGGHWSPFS